MSSTKTNVQIVFAEFPEWKKLTKADQKSLYDQMEQLWKAQEKDKARQLFDYLFDNQYNAKQLNLFVENADADFQYHYAEKLLAGCFETAGNFSEARKWLKMSQQNDADNKHEYDCPDDVITLEGSDRVKEINEQISDSFYKKHKKDDFAIFMGKQAAMINDEGHIEFVEREVCCWDAINGAQGLILAKDKPVARDKFKMTGFSPELKAIMTKLSHDTDERNCYPNIIQYYPIHDDENGECVIDDFQTECETWKVLMQLLAHGYSLVQLEAYGLEHSDKLPEAVHKQIEDGRLRVLKAFLDDDDDFNIDEDEPDADD